MIIDNQEVVFMRNDGTIVDESHVGQGGMTEDGEICFFEIVDGFRPKLKGKNKYYRINIRRVFPYVKVGENEKSN